MPHLDAAHNLARWLTQNDHDAEDVVQEAYLRAFRSFESFYGTNGRTWLLTIVRNTCYSWLRKTRAHERNTSFDEEVHDQETDTPDPQTMFQQREQTVLLREALEALPVEFREVLALRVFEDLSYKEIAGITGLPPGTVMSRLARARMRLKQMLADPSKERS